MHCLTEVFVYRYGFKVFDIFSVVIQSYIEGCFSFSNILDFTKFAFWQVYDEITFTGCFLEQFKSSVRLITFEMLRFMTGLKQSVLEFETNSEHFPLVNLLVVSSFFFYYVPSNQLPQVLIFADIKQGLIFKYLFKFTIGIQYV